tara:strand:- start:1330 stop:1533 length:204 start_codon:yes stop_codon:yes gene_type:complete
VEVAAETASIVIRRRHGDAMPSPHALPEALSAASFVRFFPCSSLTRESIHLKPPDEKNLQKTDTSIF